jgi:hypothetical protein
MMVHCCHMTAVDAVQEHTKAAVELGLGAKMVVEKHWAATGTAYDLEEGKHWAQRA